MVQLSGDLLCLYTAEIDASGDTYTLEVPKREIEHGHLTPGNPAQVALFSTPNPNEESSSPSAAATQHEPSESPPVDEGDIVDVEIDSLSRSHRVSLSVCLEKMCTQLQQTTN